MQNDADTYYDEFLSGVYDYSPFFGQARTRETDKFNRFYLDSLPSPDQGRIVEFGSATGQLSIPLARAGYRVDAVDNSRFMHAMLARKLEREPAAVRANIRQVLADATTHRGDEPYAAVVMGESFLTALPDEDLQFAMLMNCHANLHTGGRIHTDFLQPLYKVISNGSLREFSRFRDGDGTVYLLRVDQTTDRYTQSLELDCAFTRVCDGRAAETPIEVHAKFRYLQYSEIRLMLKLCAFNVLSIDTKYADGRGFSIVAEKV
jgi:SAM-dependent methyltransferase